MKHLIIIGARGFGREMFDFAHKVDPFVNGELDIKGFLDDKGDALDGYPCSCGRYPPILGSVEKYVPEDDDVFFCALGDAKWRCHYGRMMQDKGGQFINLISREAHVSAGAKIGRGVLICSWSSVSTNVEIGDFTVLHPYCDIGHDVKISTGSTLEAYVFMGGYSSIGEGSTMHVRSSVLPHKRIGSNTVVGVGSAVMRNFGDNLHLFGNPAKRIEF